MNKQLRWGLWLRIALVLVIYVIVVQLRFAP
jgi:hypothetical protein